MEFGEKRHLRLEPGVGVPYLSRSTVLEYPNTDLLLEDGKCFSLNSAILAASSRFLRTALPDTGDNIEDFSVFTELPGSHLMLFCEFITTGVLSLPSLDPQVVGSFLSLGVNLNELKLEETVVVKKEEAFENVMVENRPLKRRRNLTTTTSKGAAKKRKSFSEFSDSHKRRVKQYFKKEIQHLI